MVYYMAEIYKLQFDGSISKNPGGVAACGWIISRNGVKFYSESCVIGEGPLMSNNVAEYEGLIRGLRSIGAIDRRIDIELHVFGDSQLVIRQMKGEWAAKPDKLYYPYYQWAKELVKELSRYINVSFTWVPREQNTACDDLSKVHRKKS